MSKAPIVLAVDTADLDTAIEWVKATQDSVSVYKLGLEFFLTFGSNGVRAIQDVTDSDIFLDLKLHDIPNTVSGATKAIAHLGAKYLTVHATGSTQMIQAAVAAAPATMITAVTVLTSLSEADLITLGFKDNALNTAINLASESINSGARAIVCSPLEISAIRAVLGSEPVIITPGVRAANAKANDDQVRTMTPAQAIAEGANLVVIGRPITQSWIHGPKAMQECAAEIASQLFGAE